MRKPFHGLGRLCFFYNTVGDKYIIDTGDIQVEQVYRSFNACTVA